MKSQPLPDTATETVIGYDEKQDAKLNTWEHQAVPQWWKLRSPPHKESLFVWVALTRNSDGELFFVCFLKHIKDYNS